MAQILNKRATGPGLTVLPSTTHTGVMDIIVLEVMEVMEVQGKIVLLLTSVTHLLTRISAGMILAALIFSPMFVKST